MRVRAAHKSRAAWTEHCFHNCSPLWVRNGGKTTLLSEDSVFQSIHKCVTDTVILCSFSIAVEQIPCGYNSSHVLSCGFCELQGMGWVRQVQPVRVFGLGSPVSQGWVYIWRLCWGRACFSTFVVVMVAYVCHC